MNKNKQRKTTKITAFFQTDVEEKIKSVKPIDQNDQNLYKTKFLEIQIKRQFQNIVDENKDAIDDIKIRLDTLEIEQDEAIDQKTMNRLEQIFIELQERLDKIKKNFEILQDPDLLRNPVNHIDENYIRDLIEDYKEESKSKDAVDELGKYISEKAEVLTELKEVQFRKKQMDEKQTTKKEEIIENDFKIEQNDELVSGEKDHVQHVYSNILEYENTIETYSKKIDEIVPKMEITRVPKAIPAIVETILIATSAKIMSGKKTPANMAASAILFMIGIKGLERSMKPKVEYVPSDDYNQQFEDMLINIDSIDIYVSDSLSRLGNLESTFKERYHQFQNKPEYITSLAKLQQMERELKKQEQIISRQKTQIKSELEKNKVKVKRIQEMNRR